MARSFVRAFQETRRPEAPEPLGHEAIALACLPASQAVHIRRRHDYRNLLPQAEPLPEKRSLSRYGGVSGKPKPRYSEIRDGVPDEAQRMEPVRQFTERTLGQNSKPPPQGT